jgi:hypothetical protein
MKANRPYGIIVAVAAVGFAIFLMIWSLADSGGPGSREAVQKSSQTQGSAIPPVSNEPGKPAPTLPKNDTAADSTRNSKGPLNKSD